MNYQSSIDVLKAVISISPEFNGEWKDENPYIHDDGSYSVHAVYMVFLEFLSCKKTANSNEQVKQIALLINGAVAAGATSENAISTCFLEHLDQVGLVSIFKPLMSDAAKRRLNP